MTRPRSRRAEQLTPAEQEEWRRFVASAKPLPGRAVEPPPPSALPPPAAATPPPVGPPPPRRAAVPLEVGHHPPGVDNTRWRGLTKGRLRAERRLDLHGLTLARAHAATRSFLAAAAREDIRVVEIVTGLGERGEGAIRREFMHWLNAPDLRGLVLAVAHPPHLNSRGANQGSVRLLLKRRAR
jgi:DNA-nicking Smr family endonuclease